MSGEEQVLLLHGSCVRLHGKAALIQGPSGSGKSRLCLALIRRGGWLVADDAVRVELDGARLMAAAAPETAGLIEMRGLGLAAVPKIARAAIDGLVMLMPSDRIERLPAPATAALLGVAVPSVAIDGGDPCRAAEQVAAFLARLVLEVA